MIASSPVFVIVPAPHVHLTGEAAKTELFVLLLLVIVVAALLLPAFFD